MRQRYNEMHYRLLENLPKYVCILWEVYVQIYHLRRPAARCAKLAEPGAGYFIW